MATKELPIGAEFTVKVGTADPPDLTVTLAEDAGFDHNRNEIEKALRNGGGYVTTRLGFGRWRATLQVVWDPDDDALALLINSSVNNEEVWFQSLDDEEKGFKGRCWVQAFSKPEPNEDVVSVSITLLGNGALDLVSIPASTP